MSNTTNKEEKYTILILDAVRKLIKSKAITPSELIHEENLKWFIHALANMVPTHIYNKLSGQEKNCLEFNYVANQLVFEFAINSEKNDAETNKS